MSPVSAMPSTMCNASRAARGRCGWCRSWVRDPGMQRNESIPRKTNGPYRAVSSFSRRFAAFGQEVGTNFRRQKMAELMRPLAYARAGDGNRLAGPINQHMAHGKRAAEMPGEMAGKVGGELIAIRLAGEDRVDHASQALEAQPCDEGVMQSTWRIIGRQLALGAPLCEALIVDHQHGGFGTARPQPALAHRRGAARKFRLGVADDRNTPAVLQSAPDDELMAEMQRTELSDHQPVPQHRSPPRRSAGVVARSAFRPFSRRGRGPSLVSRVAPNPGREVGAKCSGHAPACFLATAPIWGVALCMHPAR